MLGTLARESVECHAESRNMAALTCLFILVEQAIKLALDKMEGNFNQLIIVARERQILSEEEFILLNQVRIIRNIFFHESHNAWFRVKDGIVYPFDEDETKEIIFNEISSECFNIVLRLMHNFFSSS